MISKVEKIILNNIRTIAGVSAIGEFVITKDAKVHSLKIFLKTQNNLEFSIKTLERKREISVNSAFIFLVPKKEKYKIFSIPEMENPDQLIWMGEDVDRNFDIYIYKRQS